MKFFVEVESGRQPPYFDGISAPHFPSRFYISADKSDRVSARVKSAQRLARLYPNAHAHEEYRWISVEEATVQTLEPGIYTMRLVPIVDRLQDSWGGDAEALRSLPEDVQEEIKRPVYVKDVEFLKARPQALPGRIEAESYRRFGEPFSTLLLCSSYGFQT